MAMHKKAQSALSDSPPVSPIVIQKKQINIEEFFVKKMDGKEKDKSDIVEMGSVENEDTTSTQVGGDKSIKQMLQDIMVKLEPVDEMNLKLDKMLKDINQLKGDVEENKTDILELKTSVECAQATVSDLQGGVTVLKKDKLAAEQFMVKEKVFQSQIRSLEQKVLDMETYSRRENLIFYGVPEHEGENLYETIMCVIEERLQIHDAKQRMKIVRIHRIGKLSSHSESNKTNSRPIMVRFHYFPHAMEIFRKRAELKKFLGAELEHEQRGLSGGSNVPVCTGISQDFPISISNMRNQLKQVLKVAKKCDKGAFLKVDQLSFKGSTYSLQQCYSVQELDIHSIGTVKRPTAVLFHGCFSPFSNFYPCSFSHNGIQYQCVEQFYQHQKAIHANKGLVATKI